MREKCIRCGRETIYEFSTPVTLRRYYVEGSGQLCEECFYEMYPVPGTLGSEIIDSNTRAEICLEHDDSPKE